MAAKLTQPQLAVLAAAALSPIYRWGARVTGVEARLVAAGLLRSEQLRHPSGALEAHRLHLTVAGRPFALEGLEQDAANARKEVATHKTQLAHYLTSMQDGDLDSIEWAKAVAGEFSKLARLLEAAISAEKVVHEFMALPMAEEGGGVGDGA